MACMFCRNWQQPPYKHNPQDTRGVIERYETEVGICMASPDWRKTTGLHSCAKLVVTDPMYLGMWWRAMHEKGAEIERLKSELRKQKALSISRFRENKSRKLAKTP